MLEINNLVPIGQVAVFYLPAFKLLNISGVKSMVHEFLIEHYDAYTCQSTNNEGFWRKSKDSDVIHDANVRYEVSFNGREKIPDFIDFLSTICAVMEEEAIYLTMGKSSYFVLPKGINEI